MALDSQQKRMAVAGRVFPSSMNLGQRPAVGNTYPVAAFTVPIIIAFIVTRLSTFFDNIFLSTDKAAYISLDTESSLIVLDTIPTVTGEG